MPVKNPALLPLFEQAKTLLEPYARHFTVRRDEPGYYDLLALLKGKSCFYLKKLTPTLEAQMREGLRKGYELYLERGWV